MALAVFLVEDSALIRDNLIKTLEELVQARVIAVVDSEDDAKAWLRANDRWQLAVVDIFISQGSGLGVVRALQQRLTGQRVVCCPTTRLKACEPNARYWALTRFLTSRQSSKPSLTFACSKTD